VQVAPWVFLLSLAVCCTGGDWPQYRGPNHDGVSTDRLNKQWSGAVTNPVWLRPVTNCLGSFAVSGGRAFTQTRRAVGGASREICVALSVTNGAELWAANLDTASYPNGGVGNDDGPRSTPAVDGGSVFILTSYLKLYRLNLTNGAVIWQKDLVSLYGASQIGYQNCASPLLDGGLIFLNASTGVSSLMALRTSDGSVAWRSQNEGLTHSTPLLTTISGVRQVIFATQSGLVSLDPATGTLLWKFLYPFNYGTSIGCSPVVWQDMVYVCGAQAYGMGSFVMQASVTNNTWTTSQLWANTGFSSTLSAHWMTPVCYQGFLYGQFGVGSFDSVNAQLKCVEMRTGAVKWSAPNFGRGATILADNHLLSITERGQLVLIRPNTNAYTELGRFLAIPNYSDPTNKCWNSPAVSDGRVFVRSTAFAACYDLSVPALKLDAPEFVAPDTLRLTVRTVNGSAVDSNRVGSIEVRAATNVAQPAAEWSPLTNSLMLTNGVLRMDNVDASMQPWRFFNVNEPK
jgi:outer membrane protein assembly factor BamB